MGLTWAFNVGFSKNPFLDPYGDTEQQQASPVSHSKSRPVPHWWQRGLIVSTHRDDILVFKCLEPAFPRSQGHFILTTQAWKNTLPPSDQILYYTSASVW